MDINSKAPATAQSELRIQAPLERVWRIQTDIDHWSEWNSNVQRAKLEGPLAPGSVFRWKSGGMSIVSTLEEVEPMRKLGWTGRALGVQAIHIWDFKREGDETVVTTRESFEGWWVSLLPGMTRKLLDGALREWLGSLKRRAETKG